MQYFASDYLSAGGEQISGYRIMLKHWNRKCNALLAELELTAEERKVCNLIFKHARWIPDSGRRKWKTHNRIQNIVRNRTRCTEIYQAVLPLLNEIDRLNKMR